MKPKREDKRLRKFLKISLIEGVLGQIFSTLAGPGSAFLTSPLSCLMLLLLNSGFDLP
jgi:hypothetical protein